MPRASKRLLQLANISREKDGRYKTASEVKIPEQYKLPIERLESIADEEMQFESLSSSGYRLIYKDHLVKALEASHNAGGCPGSVTLTEDLKKVKGVATCIDVHCNLCKFSHSVFYGAAKDVKKLKRLSEKAENIEIYKQRKISSAVAERQKISDEGPSYGAGMF